MLLSDAAVRHYLSHEAYKRGRQYAEAGLVRDLAWDKDEEWLTARVMGSQIYNTQVQLSIHNNKWYVHSSVCTCPVGSMCKHVGAVLLRAVRDGLVNTTTELEIVDDVAVTTTKDTEFNELMRRLYDDFPAVDNASGAQLGIWLEPNVDKEYHFDDNRRRNISIDRPILTARLAVKYAHDTTWRYGEISWQDIWNGGYRLHHVPPAQTAWAKELFELYNLQNSRPGSYYYGYSSRAGKYITLDKLARPDLMQLLIRGSTLGVQFLCGKVPKLPVEFALSVLYPQLHVQGLDDTKVRLSATFELRPERNDFVGVHGFLGKPPSLAYNIRYSSNQRTIEGITLFPIEGSPTEYFMELLLSGRSIDLTRDQFEQFKRKTAIHLRDIVEVVADDPSIDFSDVVEPELVLSVDYHAEQRQAQLQLNWLYGETKLSMYHHDDDPYARDQTTEAKTLTDLLSAFQVLEPNPWVDAERLDSEPLRDNISLSGLELVRLAREIIPEIEQLENVHVELRHPLPDFTLASETPQVVMGVHEGANGNADWFDLAVQVRLGEAEVPFEALFTALAEQQTHMLLDDGTYFSLDIPELVRLRQLIDEAKSLQEKDSSGLKISRFQVGLWEDLAALGLVEQQASRWLRSSRGLLETSEIAATTPPPTFLTKLRPYQAVGLNWLYFIWQHRLGGILADDMGLGKTVQAIALITKLIQDGTTGPILIIAPTSVGHNWVNEFKRFAPSVRVRLIRETSAKKTSSLTAQDLTAADVIVTSYGLLRWDAELYRSVDWSMLILDEAQFVKNHQSKGYAEVRKLRAEFKLALTGTPFENNLMELWAILSIVAPGLFPRPDSFKEFYQEPIEKQGNAEMLATLRRRVKPLMLRRSKELVATELPPKQEQTLEIDLNPAHRKAYDLHLQHERQKVLGMLGDMQKNRFAIFKSLTTLRLLSLDPKLVDAKKHHAVHSTKLDSLLEQLEPVLADGHRALIFSQFTSFLKTVRSRLSDEGIAYSYLDGATTNRQAVLDGFKNSSVPIFLISLKAGGFGLNLTEADYCFILDPWWNPAVEAQAVDRAHRIGQTKQVMVYRLVASGTIEEKVMALKAKKAKLFGSMFEDGGAFSSQLTREDIAGLFE